MTDATVQGPVTTDCFLVRCSTCCSCCREDNHTRGPFLTMVGAEAAVVKFRERKLTASQFSKEGKYKIETASCELISHNRMIINGSTVMDVKFVDSDPLSDDAIYSRTDY